MSERRGRAGDAGIADQNVEFAVALMQRRAEPGGAVEVGEIERYQSGAAAVLADLVVELLEAALRPRHRHHVRAGFCQRPRGGIADAARGAGDESDTGGEEFCHGQSIPELHRRCHTGLTRVSTALAREFHETMDCRVKPGNDEPVSSPPPAATIAAVAARPGSGR